MDRELFADALDLVDKLLAMDPKDRLTAGEAADHDYLWQPEPKKPEEYVVVEMDGSCGVNLTSYTLWGSSALQYNVLHLRERCNVVPSD